MFALGVLIFTGWWSRSRITTNNIEINKLIGLPDHGQVIAKFISASDVDKTDQLSLELVNTNASITQGLSDRSSLGTDGMLFVFANKFVPKFWMKGMLFDLDMVWLDRGRIVDLTTDIKAPDPATPLNQLPTYSSSRSVNMVLELPAGAVKTYNLQIGDLLKLQLP